MVVLVDDLPSLFELTILLFFHFGDCTVIIAVSVDGVESIRI